MQQVIAREDRRHTFRAEAAAMNMRQAIENSVEPIMKQFRDGLSDVMQEPFAAIGRADRHPGHHRQPAQQIIAATPAKFPSEIGCPILTAAFPAVYMKNLEHPPCQLG